MKFAETKSRNIQDCFNLIYPEILGKAELADYCFANVRTVDLWAKQDSLHIKRKHHIEKIEKLAAVITLLEAELSFTPEEAREFLTTTHVDVDSATLEYRTMIDLLATEDDGLAVVAQHALQQNVG